MCDRLWQARTLPNRDEAYKDYTENWGEYTISRVKVYKSGETDKMKLIKRVTVTLFATIR